MSNKIKQLFSGDVIIWIIFFLLCCISLLEVFSASSASVVKHGILAPLIRQSGYLFIGFIFIIVFSRIPCRYFKILPILTIPLSAIMLIVVKAFGSMTNGAQRWISIFGINIQPSEVAKWALVMTTALILSRMQTEKGADRRAMKYILWISIPLIFLIFLDNVSTAVIISAVLFFMMILGRVSAKQLSKLVGVVLLLIGIVAATLWTVPETVIREIPLANRLTTAKARVENYLSTKEISPEEFDIDKDRQKAHANIAIASSGYVGKWVGNSVERNFLTHAYSDFIYAIIIEETGLWGAGIILILYLILLFRAGIIASECQNSFPAFLAMGCALLLVTQAFFNMLVAVGLGPITGQPLPLITRGGTSIAMTCIEIGMILSVSNTKYKTSTNNTVFASPAKNKGLIPDKS